MRNQLLCRLVAVLALLLVLAPASSRAEGVANRQMAAGYFHSVALKSDGTVWSWGDNSQGQLGDGTRTGRVAPVQVAGLSGITAVSAGLYHNLALKGDGTVWSWGDNASGQLGDGTTNDLTVPVRVPGLTGVTAVAAGSYFSLALKSDGSVWTWGGNSNGQLGDGTGITQRAPVQVSNLAGVVAVAAGAGGSHSAAVKSDGTVWTWGWNPSGQLGDGTTSQRFTPVQVPGLSGVRAAAAGSNHTLALKEDGTLWGWGSNNVGQLGDGTTTQRLAPTQVAGLTGVSAVAAGNGRTFALKGDGTVWAWGSNSNSELGDGSTAMRKLPVQLAGLTAISELVSGVEHCLARKSNGTIWTWGTNRYGQLGDGSTTSRKVPVRVAELAGVVALAGGDYHSLAVRSDGSVWAWGGNGAGQLGDGTFEQRPAPVRVSGLNSAVAVASRYEKSVALQSDGSVWAWGGSHGATPVQLAGFAGITAIGAGEAHVIALKNDGTVWSSGWNYYGQLGDGTNSDRNSAVQVAGLEGVVALAAGNKFSLALKGDGSVWAWGANFSGQLGDGSSTDRPAPVQVTGLSGVIALSAGDQHGAVLKSDGTVWTWGINYDGRLGDGSTNSSSTPVQVPGLGGITAVSAGQSFTAALKSDGTIWAWGGNDSGQLGDFWPYQYSWPVQVSGLASVSAIAACGRHGLALRGDGSIDAWGNNAFGQLGDGTRSLLPKVMAPITTALPPGGLYTTAQSASLLCSDGPGPGCAGTYYCLGAGCTPATPVAGAVSIASSGDLRFYSQDLAGTSEAVKTVSFTISADPFPPSTTAVPAGGYYASPQDVVLSCNDGTGSGCAATYYCLGTGCTPDTPYSGAINVASDTVIRFYSRDLAGNQGEVAAASYSVPSSFPVSVLLDGTGSGTVTGPQLSCSSGSPEGCSTTASRGASLTLTATPAPGSVFARWSGPCATVSVNQCEVLVDSSVAVTATFSSTSVPEPELLFTGGDYWNLTGNSVGEVVWSSYDQVEGGQVYSNLRGRLSPARDSYRPLLNNMADLVWTEFRTDEWGGAPTYTVKGIISGRNVQLASSQNGLQGAAINDRGEVVWLQWGYQQGSSQIYSSVRGLLTIAPGEYEAPSLNNRGDVVWLNSNGPGTRHIYKLAAGSSTPVAVTAVSGDYYQPAINDAGEVVWLQAIGGYMQIVSSLRGQLTSGVIGSVQSLTIDNCGGVLFGARDDSNSTTALYRIGAACLSQPEPNDSREQAAPVSLGDIFTGLADASANRVDWYRFEAAAGDTIHLTVNYDSGAGNQLNLGLYDEGGSLLTGPTRFNPAGIDLTAQYGGSYYLKLEAQSGRIGYAVSLSKYSSNCGVGPCPELVVTGSEGRPAINSLGEVFWLRHDQGTGKSQIFSSLRGQLTSDPVQHQAVAGNNLGDLVWVESSDSYPYQNSVRGIINGQPVTFFSSPDSIYQVDINDRGEVVWNQADGAGGSKIFSNLRGQITSGQLRSYEPSINNRGDLVFAGIAEPGPSQVYLLAAGSTQPVALTSDSLSHYSPSISDSGEVVWSEPTQQGTAGRLVSSVRGVLVPYLAGSLGVDLNNCGDIVYGTYGPDGSASYRLGRSAPCMPVPERLFPLTVRKDMFGSGNGAVSSSPAGIQLNPADAIASAAFPPDSTVTLTATPESNSVFIGWSGACFGTGPCQVTMDMAQTVTAHFALVQDHNLTLEVSGSGAGMVVSAPVGIFTGANASARFNGGAEVTLHAIPAPFSIFTGWSGACAGTGDCLISMTQDWWTSATFAIDWDRSTLIPRGAGIYRPGIQAAYNAGADSDTIKLWAIDFTGDIICADDKRVDLHGGYNEEYSSREGATVVRGALRVSGGVVNIDKLTFR